MADQELYSGLIRLHILYHASKEPVFGLGMIRELRRHRYEISPGTLYPILHRLQAKKYLASREQLVKGKFRRCYTITRLGRQALRQARAKVRELFDELFEDDTPDIQQHIVLRGVSWSYYDQTLNEIGNQPVQVAFLDGVMELMSPLPEHEGPKRAIGNLVVTLAVECQVPFKSFGSTTFRTEQKAAGSEPDECFYFNDIASVKGMKRFDPLLHRAPDLWVEVDVLNPSVPREPICARLGVPEVWRYSRDRLALRLLTPAGVYADSSASLAFPFLPMTRFAKFIQEMIDGDEMKALLEFREWVRGLPR